MWFKARELPYEPGLIMVQIDGFSKTELEKALQSGEMPFLKNLIEDDKYRLHALYTGLPSTTPAVQGELFYGIKQCVPSFFFYDRPTKKVFRMYDGDSVRTMEERLAAEGEGLLKGGSSYSNIYGGGAKETHFCAGSLGWQNVWKDVNFFEFLFLLSTHFIAVVRMVFLCIWETILALMDFIYGLLKREDIEVELKFVPLRILLCILLRELVTLGATMDTARGLPVIHLNYLGYDEQAHRRGPGSKTAHWSLKGIDKAISRIYNAAMHSSKRHYDLWVYSDHGQEITTPYVGLHQEHVEGSIGKIFHELFDQKTSTSQNPSLNKKPGASIQLQRARYLGKWVAKLWPLDQGPDISLDHDLVVAVMGPVGGIYVFKELIENEKFIFAQELVQRARIPLVFMPHGDQVLAWNQKGKFVLPQQAKEVLGPDHPYLEDVVKDLVDLCHHPNAGTFTISGWDPSGRALSFPFENGAHAGPGLKETDAFALLPANIRMPLRERSYLRTKDLRELALRSLDRLPAPVSSQIQPKGTVRIMTYNVHSCIGMDHKISPSRIAQVIGRYDPDIVLLQEVDVGRKHSGEVDQPHLIAKELQMIYHFHPSIQIEEEKYGNAVFSRYPMQLVQAAQLPVRKNRFNLEPRGAMWVSIKIGDVDLQVINTHLSFFGPESRHQAGVLMGPQWLGDSRCNGPVVLCGDFNFLPQSAAWRMINQKLNDVQQMLKAHRPAATWVGRYPLGRIDHIFISPDIKVCAVEVPKTSLNKTASDHLPLIADLEIFK